MGVARDVERLGGWDWVVVMVYLIVLFVSATISTTVNRGALRGYFLAHHSAPFWLVALSLFSTNIGHLIGLASSAAKSGLAVAAYDLASVYYLVLLAWVFYPVYRSCGVHTMPEYLRMRFGGRRITVHVVVMSFFLHAFTKNAAELYVGAAFIATATDDRLGVYWWAVVLAILSAFFALIGGVTAVMWTDALQSCVMLSGSAVLLYRGLEEVGGLRALFDRYPFSLSTQAVVHSGDASYPYRHCGRPDPRWSHLLRPHDDPTLPWTGLVFGVTASGLWYWCCDQVIVQRLLAAKDVLHAKMGAVVTCTLKATSLFLFVLPGMIARVLYPQEVACNEPDVCRQVCNVDGGCTDAAYCFLILRLMPEGCRGLMVAVVLAALLSSLTAVFHATSTLATLDMWALLRPSATDVQLMLVGRLAVTLQLLVSLACVPVMELAPTVYLYVQDTLAALSPPIAAAVVVAVVWDRATEPAIFWSLVVGLLIGLSRFSLGLYDLATQEACGRTLTAPLSEKPHFLHFGPLLFLTCLLIIVVVSLVTPPPDQVMYHGKTFFSRHAFIELNAAAQVPSQRPSIQYYVSRHSFARRIGALRVSSRLSLTISCLLWACGMERMVRDWYRYPDAAGPASLSLRVQRRLGEPPRLSHLVSANMVLVVVSVSCLLFYFA